jgi:hypothetical protein
MQLVLPLFLAQAGGEPPLAGRPANFSHIVGGFRIQSQAQPRAVEVEKPVLLTVRIQGEGDPRFLPQRKLLKIFPEGFDDQFFVEDLAELDRTFAAEKTWEFIYRLRPKTAEVEFIPSLKLVFYHPGRKRYTTTVTEPIPLTVKSAAQAEVKLPVKTILAPESFFETASVQAMLGWQWQPTSAWKAAAELLALACLILVGSRYLLRGRQRAPRKTALLSIDYAGSVGQLRGALHHYLQHRFHLPQARWTGTEMVQRLRRLGLERPLLESLQAFLARCDAARFSPNYDLPIEQFDAWCAEAQGLVDSVEADPCAARSA